MRRGKKYGLIIFSLMILLMSWEGQKIDSAAAEGAIPQQSIRLRILAHSDGVGDQIVKRRVRDAVVEQMNAWVGELEDPQSLEAARGVIREHLDEIGERVGETLAESGKKYGYKVELGMVPFPTKMYGGAVYPAGDYEALRVTLGEGNGKNWWCVLFPPLCFVDAGSGDALQNGQGSQAVSAQGGADQPVQAEPGETKVRFFLWDMLVRLWDWIAGLFR